MSAGATQEVSSAEVKEEEEEAAEATAAEDAVWSRVHTLQRTEEPRQVHCASAAQGPLVGLRLPRLSVPHLPRLPQFGRCAFFTHLINPFFFPYKLQHLWPYCGQFQMHRQLHM